LSEALSLVPSVLGIFTILKAARIIQMLADLVPLAQLLALFDFGPLVSRFTDLILFRHILLVV
jgi:hypothetical protein